MEKIKIIELDNEPYDYLAIAVSPDYDPTIDNNIKKVRAEVGAVRFLYDLTLINGINSNRYVESYYVPGKLLPKESRAVPTISDSIRNISYSFFEKNAAIVQKSPIQ